MVFARFASVVVALALAGSATLIATPTQAGWPSAPRDRVGSGKGSAALRQELLHLARTLGSRLPARAQPLVEAGLHDADPEVRRVAAELTTRLSLTLRQRQSLGRVVVPWLGSASARERAWAVQLLAPTADRQLLRELVPLLSDFEAPVRLAAARSFSTLPAPLRQAGAEALTSAMNDSETEVRMEAARSLGLLGEETGVLSLVGALRDPDASVRVAAATAIGAIGRERGLDALVASLDDPDDQVVLTAVRSLSLHPAPSRETPLIAVAEREPFDAPAREAVRALAALGGERATEVFVGLLQRTDARPAVLQLLEADSTLRHDWTGCLSRAVGPTLQACAGLHLAQGGSEAPLRRAQSERRLSESALLHVARGHAREAFIVRALRVISAEGDVLSSQLGEAALDYLRSLGDLPAEASGPVLRALDRGVSSSETAASLLGLLFRLPAETPIELGPQWLEASSSAVSFMAALALVRHDLQGERLPELLAHPRRSVARGALAALSQRANQQQVGLVLRQLAAGSSGRQAELARALDGIFQPLSAEAEADVDAALQQTRWALATARPVGLRARESLLSTVGRWGSARLLDRVLPRLGPADRRTLVQALEFNAEAAALVPRFFEDDSPRVVALAVEVAARVGVLSPPEAAASGPHFLRAAWWRSLQLLEAEAAQQALAEKERWLEACRSEHSGLRAAAWGVAAVHAVDCGTLSPLHGLRLDEDVRIRRAVAHGLARRAQRHPALLKEPAIGDSAPNEEKRNPVAAALRVCVVYDPDPRVADSCRRARRRGSAHGDAPGVVSPASEAGQGHADAEPVELERTRLRVPWAEGRAAGVPFPVWQDDVLRVLVSDRVGEVLLVRGEREAGDAGLGY